MTSPEWLRWVASGVIVGAALSTCALGALAWFF